MRRIGTKLLLAGLTLAATPFLLEGLCSLVAGRSLRDLGRGPWLEQLEVEVRTDAERRALANRTRGPFRVPEDPLVGYTLKLATEVELVEARVETTALGLRREARAEPAPGDFHLVLLGDSVAYGHGLAPEEALGPRLEALYAAARASDEPRVAVTTVALPGWNHWNSIRFLLDHLERLAPDLVVFLPVRNDLDDAYGVDELGERALRPDPTSSEPLADVRGSFDLFRRMARQAHGVAALRLFQDEEKDQWRARAALTPSARRRLDEFVENVVRLHTRLARAGARLALAPYQVDTLARMLRAGLVERGLDLPEIPLLDRLRAEDGQGKDPHPNAETTRALALWLADGLVLETLVPRRSRAWPDVPERLRERRAAPLPSSELGAWRAAFVRAEEDALDARIAPQELRGLNQVYGGLAADASLGPRALLVLPRGRTLEVELEATLEAPGFYPLPVRLAVDGEPLGELVLTAPGARARGTFALPAAATRAAFELCLAADDHALCEVAGRVLPLVARFLAAESRP